MPGLPIYETLKNLGLAPSKSRGQNFLKDGNIIAKIVKAALGLTGEPAQILEIGPGLGALTWPLVASGAKVWAVELDRGLAANLSVEVAKNNHQLTLLNQDILTLDPASLEAVAPLTLCGNLPYNISSPVMFWFLKHRRYFNSALFMLQKELAERLTASPGGKTYGRLTVALSLWSQVGKVMTVPPTAFHPRPRVDSQVVSIKLKPEAETPALALEDLSRLTAIAFAARRKTIFNNLSRVYERQKVLDALASLEITPDRRPETLPPPVFAALAQLLQV